MKKYILSLLCALSFMMGQAQQVATSTEMIARAASAYDNGQYEESIRCYEMLCEAYGTSPVLFYNLGNAYFKTNDFAHAILNYERCLLYDPANADAQHNLELARMKCVDKIDSIDPIIFEVWSNAVRDLQDCDAWGRFAIAFFIVFIICVFCYFFLRKVALRKAGFYGSIVALILSLVGVYYANAQHDRLAVRDYAIVMEPSVTVRSSPAESGTQLFTIHEGLKVKVCSTVSDWSEVELSDGHKGWMPTASLTRI